MDQLSCDSLSATELKRNLGLFLFSSINNE